MSDVQVVQEKILDFDSYRTIADDCTPYLSHLHGAMQLNGAAILYSLTGKEVMIGAIRPQH